MNIQEALELSKAEIQAFYRRFGYSDSNVLRKIDDAITSLSQPKDVEDIRKNLNSHKEALKLNYSDQNAFCSGFNECFELIEAYLQPQQSEWISVEDRFPKEDGSYLCWDKYHRERKILCYNSHHECWDQEDGDDYYTDLIGGKVTHWMPLQQPPKETQK